MILRKDWETCDYQSLPGWLRDNEHLIGGHRPPIPSVAGCLRSMFRIHTETVNIWTHLLGLIVIMTLGAQFLADTDYPTMDKLTFVAFFSGAILCLTGSATFHIFCCHSPKISRVLNRLDYSGIAALIVGSTVPWVHYGFYSDRSLRFAYISINLTLGFATLFLTLSRRFERPETRGFRAAIFVLLGVSSAFPCYHYVLVHGFSFVMSGWTAIMGFMYILGAFLYAQRIPEKFYPGKFDIFFNSHQLFHVLVVGAALVHFKGISEMAKVRYSEIA